VVRLGDVAGRHKKRQGSQQLEGELGHVGRESDQVKPQQIGQYKDHRDQDQVKEKHDPPGEEDAVQKYFQPHTHRGIQ